ncbi:MAG: flagellar motor stator protein MotA [Fimbriimonadia bacterium]|jgi:chemotaxis protein MotA
MALIVGMLVVFGSIIFGFTMAGGKLAVLLQIAEFIVIGGAAVGSMIVSHGPGVLGRVLREVMALMKPHSYNKESYKELLKLLFTLFNLSRREGLLALESHVERPSESEVFTRFPNFLQNHHALHFFCDTMKVILTGTVSPMDLSDMMDNDLDAAHEQEMVIPNLVQSVADAMPGFGIVAAVLGVVITMGSVGGSPAEIGHHVAAALVGTFLGVLCAYGIFGPLSSAMKMRVHAQHMYMMAIKNALISFGRGEAPLTCCEFARRNIEPELRPGFNEMEDFVREKAA